MSNTKSYRKIGTTKCANDYTRAGRHSFIGLSNDRCANCGTPEADTVILEEVPEEKPEVPARVTYFNARFENYRSRGEDHGTSAEWAQADTTQKFGPA
jgi:hypothetical protein